MMRDRDQVASTNYDARGDERHYGRPRYTSTTGRDGGWASGRDDGLRPEYPRQQRRWDNNNAVQDRFLARCVREAQPVVIQTRDDAVRNGVIRGYDNWSLLFEEEGNEYLIFKNGIMTIQARDEY